MAESDCLFCGIVAGSIPSETIDVNERTVSFMDISPATTGHALVVPRVHSKDLLEIEEGHHGMYVLDERGDPEHPEYV